MSTVWHQGRLVSRHWHRRYVLGIPPRPAARPRMQILVQFQTPALPLIREPAEIRLLGLATARDRKYVREIQALFPIPGNRHRPTFFPALSSQL